MFMSQIPSGQVPKNVLKDKFLKLLEQLKTTCQSRGNFKMLNRKFIIFHNNCHPDISPCDYYLFFYFQIFTYKMFNSEEESQN